MMILRLFPPLGLAAGVFLCVARAALEAGRFAALAIAWTVTGAITRMIAAAVVPALLAMVAAMRVPASFRAVVAGAALEAIPSGRMGASIFVGAEWLAWRHVGA
jgi:hypothetical protein